MNPILQVLVEVTVYSFVLFAAIMLLKRIFRKHLSPVMGYAVWALLIVRLLIPVTIDGDFRLFVIPETMTQEAQTISAQDQDAQPIAIEQTNGIVQEAAQEWQADNHTLPDVSQNTDSRIYMNESRPQAWNIDWQTALIMLWAAGVAGFMAYMLLLFKRIRHNIRRKSVSAPDNILQCVQACKKDMGIKADIEVLVQSWFETPALTASLKPKLLLPKSMLRMGDKQIKYGIRHELIHYRHKDYLTVLLLMLLRCVYWFNPVVWLASRQIETDMEAACDVGVTGSLGKLERVEYVRTMIDLGSENRAYMLGMGMRSDRRSMEKRVRGIFMEKRTKLSVKFVTVTLSCLLVFACFTTACQPIQSQPVDSTAENETQTEEVVTQAVAAPVPTPTPEANPNEGFGNFPDWVETYTIPKLECDINAQIVTPDTDVFPIYKVKRRQFDNDLLKKIVDYFAGDAIGVREFSYTEDELKEQLAAAKKYDEGKEAITRLKEEINSAEPEVFGPVINGTSLLGNYIYLTDDDKKVYIRSSHNDILGDELYVTKYSAHYGVQPESWIRDGGPSRLVKPMDKALENTKISEQEACEQAMSVISDLGIDNIGVARTERAIVVNGYSDDILSGGWLVTLTRNDGGSIPVDFYFSTQTGGLLNFTEEDYVGRWENEWIDIYVDDSGVQSLSWRDPIAIAEVTDDNAALMPFEDVKQAIRDNIKLGMSNVVEAGYAGGTCHIVVDKIVLSNVLVPQREDTDYQMLAPAWLVYYRNVWEDGKGETNEGFTTVFAVNAVDGSAIDLRWRLTEEQRTLLEEES